MKTLEREAWLTASATHSQILHSTSDLKTRLRLLHSAPIFSLWHDLREELGKAADRIEMLETELAGTKEDKCA